MTTETDARFVERTVQCASPSGLHRMAYSEWGEPDNPKVLICVHGLSRNGRDFDALARVMAADYRVISAESIKRIGDYIGRTPKFDSFADAEKYIRLVSAPFGALTGAQWRQLTESSLRPSADGHLEMRFDAAGIAESFRRATTAGEIDLWPIYERIRCPTLVVRGAESDLLTRETLQAMASRGPRPEVVEVPGVGHAPMFMDDAQIGIARRFFLAA